MQITGLSSTAGMPAGSNANPYSDPGLRSPGPRYSLPNGVIRAAGAASLFAAYSRVQAGATDLPAVFRSVFLIMLLLLPALQAGAGVITFDNLPDAYLFTDGGQNIGSFYPGVTFGPNVTGLDLTGSTAFPPPFGGSIVAWDPTDDPVTIAFADPQIMVGIWYTSLDPLTLDAFDSSGDLLDSTTGAANTDGTTGESTFLSLTDPNIASVTFSGTPGNYVFDGVTTEVAPEPGTLFLLASALTGLLVLCRVRAVRPPFSGSGLPPGDRPETLAASVEPCIASFAPFCGVSSVARALFVVVCCLASAPFAGAQTGGPFLYVANSGDGTVTVIDASTNTAVSTLRLGGSPQGVGANSSVLAVFSPHYATVSFINLDTQTVSKTLSLPTGVSEGGPGDVKFSPDGALAYVSDGCINYGCAPSVYIVDVTSATVIGSLAITGGYVPNKIALSPDGSRLYVASSGPYSFSAGSVQILMSSRVAWSQPSLLAPRRRTPSLLLPTALAPT